MALFTLLLPLLGAALLIAVVYLYVLRTWAHFIERNVKFIRGMPIVGSAYRAVLGLEAPAISLQRCYDRYPTERIVGIYDVGGRPQYLLRDPKLVAQLRSQYSAYFVDKRARRTVSGAPMDVEQLYRIVAKCSAQFVTAIKASNRDVKLFDARDLFARYANDVVTATAFGVERSTVRDGADGDSLLLDSLMGQSSFNRLISQSIRVLLQLINVPVASERTEKADRKDCGRSPANGEIGRGPANGQRLRKLSDVAEDCSAENGYADCVLFLLDSFHSIASSACFLFLELAINPDIQSKLYAEIESTKQQPNNGRLTHDALAHMDYLDAVVAEVFRRWCPVPQIQRTCVKPVVIDDGNGGRVQLAVGDTVVVPGYAIHMDEAHYRNPEKFDPERFSRMNRKSIQPDAYLPFGGESNNHTGVQFASMLIKAFAVDVLAEFHIDKCMHTQDPVVLKASTQPHILDAEKGFHIDLRRRNPEPAPYKSQIFS